MIEPTPHPGFPRWLKALGLFALLLAVVLGILVVSGHDPMAHGMH